MAKRKRKGRSKQKAHGARNHKDRLFCDIFSIKENALSLFNATNDTDYTDADALEVCRGYGTTKKLAWIWIRP